MKVHSNKNKLNRDIFWNILSLIILAICGFIINPIILKIKGPEALGVFNQVFSFFIVVSQFSVGGIQFSVLHYCSKNVDGKEKYSIIISSALFIVLFIGIINSVILYSFLEVFNKIWSTKVVKGILFIIPGLIFYSLNKVMIMSLNGMRYMISFAIFQAMRYILILSAIILIALKIEHIEYLSISLTFAETILFFILVIYIKYFVVPIKIIKSKKNIDWIKKHLSFGFRGFLSGALIELNTRIDILMLGIFTNDLTVGIYSFASTFAEGFSQIINVVKQNIDPIIGKAISLGNKEEVEELSKSLRKKYYPILIILGIIAITCFPIFIKILGTQYNLKISWGVFAILITGITIPSGYRIFISILVMGGKPGMFTILIAMSAITNTVLNLIFIPNFGIFGPAISTMLLYISEAIFVVIITKKVFGIKL